MSTLYFPIVFSAFDLIHLACFEHQKLYLATVVPGNHLFLCAEVLVIQFSGPLSLE